MFFNKVYLDEPYFCSVWDRSAENCVEDPDHILSSDGVEHVFLRPFCGVNMQEWFEILWEGVEAAKNHHHLEKKCYLVFFLFQSMVIIGNKA